MNAGEDVLAEVVVSCFSVALVAEAEPGMIPANSTAQPPAASQPAPDIHPPPYLSTVLFQPEPKFSVL